ncbi:MAG: ABC transporter permease [Myxococcota bacterium]
MRLFDLDSWQEIAQTIQRNRLRTALTAAGVFWGMFMLLLMQGFGVGMQNGVQRSMGDNVTNSVYIWSGRTSMPHRGRRPGRWITFDNQDTVAIAEQLPIVGNLSPRLQLGGFRSGITVKRGHNVGSFQIMGDVAAYQNIEPMVFEKGRYVNRLDVDGRRKVAVIGIQVFAELFDPGEDPIGAQIAVQGVNFTVVGMMRAASADDRADRLNGSITIPFSTFQQAFNQDNRVGWYAFTASDERPASEAEAAVRALLAERHDIHPDDPGAIGGYNAEVEFRRIQNLFIGMRGLVWFVGAMTLLSGVVGVSNVMLISVAERTREIGVRRAIGASRLDIVLMILQEAVVLTAVAGYTGLVAGVAATEGLGAAVGDANEVLSEPRVDVEVALIAAGLLVIAGALAGALPALRAANIHPVEALRSE